MPKVSVIVPNYNHARYLPARLGSIREQTFRDFELIFLDDVSTDNSLGVAEAFAREFPMRIVANEVNSGTPFAQWNKGVELAAGEMVWIAESDDVSEPRFLERVVGMLEAHPAAALAYASSRRMDAEGAVGLRVEDNYRSMDAELWEADHCGEGPEACRRFLCHANIICNASAAVIRREAYREAGGADVTFRYCGDWELWSRLMARASYGYVAEPLNYHRRHTGSIRNAEQQEQAIREMIRILEGLMVCPGLGETVYRNATDIIAAKTVNKIRQGRLGIVGAMRLLRRLRGGTANGLLTLMGEGARQVRSGGWRA